MTEAQTTGAAGESIAAKPHELLHPLPTQYLASTLSIERRGGKVSSLWLERCA